MSNPEPDEGVLMEIRSAVIGLASLFMAGFGSRLWSRWWRRRTRGRHTGRYHGSNVFGLIETTRAALPTLRERGGGRVVNFSSGAGIAGIAGDGC
jgi:NAD(P)-dependent dehydrogenase (short-subunit alcohol dehydrogenase family)